MLSKIKWVKKTGPVHCFGRCQIQLNELENYLGGAHYIERDPFCTHSGVEYYWMFEVKDGVALAFRFQELIEDLDVGSNQPLEDAMQIAHDFIPVALQPCSGLMWD